jgi:hypothetical protein
MTDVLTPELVRLRELLRDRIAAEIAAPAPTRGRRADDRRRRAGRLRLGLAVAAAAVVLVGIGALVGHDAPGRREVVTGSAGPDAAPPTATARAAAVARNLPDSAVLFTGTDPSCRTTGDPAVFACTLASVPTAELLYSYKGTAETLVDDTATIVGGCRGDDQPGLHWTCYVGQQAVDQHLIAADLLGDPQPSPGRG